MLDALDRWLYLALNAGPDASIPVFLFAVAMAKYVILLVPLHLALVWMGGDRMTRFIALTALLALLLALAASQVIGLVAYAPRPFILGVGHTLIEHRPSSSFPSNHGIVFFAYAATLAIFGKGRLAGALAGTGLVVAWSRIYLGVHFPLDMAGSAAISLASALVAAWVMTRFGLRVLGGLERVQRAIGDVAGGLIGRRPIRS